MSSIKDGPMAVVYLAGKYRDVNPWSVEKNIREVEVIALEVASLGLAPLCVHSAFRYFDGTLTGQTWVDITLALMKRCDALLVCGGNWLSSEGTRNEIRVANEIGLPVYYELAALASHAMRLGWI